MNSYADVTTLKSGAYLDISATTNDAYLRDLLEAASRMIDDYCERYFYVYEGTKYYDGAGSLLWLDDVLSVTTLKNDDDDDGTFENTLTQNTDFYLYPLNDTVKTRAVIRTQGSYSGFANGIKKGVEVVGIFGYGDGTDSTPYHDAGTDVNEASGVTATATTITVDDGTKFAIGQTIRIITSNVGEQMYITGIATHVLTVERGKNGTTAATHDNNDDVYIYDYPEPIKEACLIQTMRWWTRKDTAFADVIGVPELGTVVAKKGLDPDVKELLRPFKRYA